MKNTQPHSRLKEARINAGVKSATDAARIVGVNPVTYTAHENGRRAFDREHASLYAKHYGVDPAWLIFGEAPATEAVESPSRSRFTPVRGGQSEPTNLDEFWDMPNTFIEEDLEISLSAARVMEIVGDYMYDPSNPSAPGSLLPGDRVIIDTMDTLPTPPGVFAVFDGAAVSIRMIEAIPSDDTLTVRVTGRNPRYQGYERDVKDVPIVGRVKAKVKLF